MNGGYMIQRIGSRWLYSAYPSFLDLSKNDLGSLWLFERRYNLPKAQFAGTNVEAMTFTINRAQFTYSLTF
ncbi:MAG: hypothetical protein ACLPX9_04680 [Rhodomicrobium sp.]